MNLKQIMDTGTKVIDKVGNKLSEGKELALDLLPETDFDYIESKLTSLGYKVPKIEIKLTLPLPSIYMEIDLDKSVIDILAQDKVVNEIDFENEKESETNKVLVKIIQGLNYAAKVNDKIKFRNKKLSRVVVEGSIIPSVKLVYLDMDVSAQDYLRDKNA